MPKRFIAVPLYGLVAFGGGAAAQNILSYESAYADYRPYRDEAVASWQGANEEAARIGGHAGVFGGGTHGAHGGMKPPQAAPAVNKPPEAAQPAPSGSHAHQ